MKSSLLPQVILVGLVALLLGCSDDGGPSPSAPGQNTIPPVEDSFDSDGGLLETEGDAGAYAVEIPAGALSDTVVISLGNVSGEPVTSVASVFAVDGIPVALGLSDPSAVLDTLYLQMPGFSPSDSLPLTALYLPATDAWIPLPHDTLRAGSIRVALPPEALQTRGRDGAIAWIYELLFGETPDATPELCPLSSAQPQAPVVLLIHGLGMNDTPCDTISWADGYNQLPSLLGERIGEVWSLSWPWHKRIFSVDDLAIAKMRSHFGNREIYIIAHSKGGLLACSIIRQTEAENLNITKAVFLGTPHFGTVAGLWEPLAEFILSGVSGTPAIDLLVIYTLLARPGILECLPNSSTIQALSQPLSFVNPPAYACVYGTEDLLVSPNSADLTRPEHAGDFESAVLRPSLELPTDHAGVATVKPAEGADAELWIYLEAFLADEEPPPPPPADFVLVPAGSFLMGAPADELGTQSDERPQHAVTLTHPFYLQSTEVTNQQYMQMAQWAYNHGYVTATSSSLRDALDGSTLELLDMDDSDCEIDFSGGVFTCVNPDHPVKEVTWYGAVAYCDWLSMQAGLPRAYNHSTWQCNANSPYTAAGYRLPTEAEWEYACRAGSTTAFANGPITYIDCTLDPVLNQIGWYCGNAGGWTHPVGQKIPNDWGLYDMHGNLWEWCNDWYSAGYYGSSPSSNPVGPTSGSYRVPRGGGWSAGALCCRSAFRYGHSPGYGGLNLGFRPARSAD